MRYEIKANQIGMQQWNKNNPGKRIDLVDAVLLFEIDLFQSQMENIETKSINDNKFYWIAYRQLIKQLPEIGISTTDAIGRRIKKLCRFNLLDKITDYGDNNKTYLRLTSTGLQTVRVRMANRKGTGLQTVRGTDDKPYDKSIHEKAIKDKKELSALSFFEKYNSKDFKFFKSEYGLRIRDFKKFEMDFNDVAVYKKIDFETNDLKNFLFAYAKGWIKNQNKYEPIAAQEPIPLDRRKIS